MAKPSITPEWNTGEANNTEPSGAKKILGWINLDPAASSYFNWWMNLVWKWIGYVNESQFVTACAYIYTDSGTPIVDFNTSNGCLSTEFSGGSNENIKVTFTTTMGGVDYVVTYAANFEGTDAVACVIERAATYVVFKNFIKISDGSPINASTDDLNLDFTATKPNVPV